MNFINIKKHNKIFSLLFIISLLFVFAAQAQVAQTTLQSSPIQRSPQTSPATPVQMEILRDLTKPQVVSTSPSNDATNIAVSASIIIDFNESMNTGSLDLVLPSGVTWSAPVWSNSNKTVTLGHGNFTNWNTLLRSGRLRMWQAML